MQTLKFSTGNKKNELTCKRAWIKQKASGVF